MNAINGKNTIAPTIETLSIIIKVCKMSNHPKRKNISYEFLLNDNMKEIEAKTAQVYQEIGSFNRHRLLSIVHFLETFKKRKFRTFCTKQLFKNGAFCTKNVKMDIELNFYV